MLNLEISNDFHKFIKSLNETNSKHGEERVIYREISKLKISFQNKNITKSEIYKNLMKCMHIEMLGFSTKFAYIHAVNLAQDKDLKFKSLGYLCCTLMLQNNDLVILLINTIQKDLSSGNVMNKLLVLSNLSYLMNEEMLEIVLPLILNCLTHENELVRKKTIILLTHIYQLYPTLLHTNITHIIERGMYDINPSVMNVTLTLLRIYITGGNSVNEDLWINVLMNIWKQILDNKLNRTFYYNRIAAPFIQLNIMKLLSLLCHNIELSNLIYNILYKFTQSLESHTNYFNSGNSVTGVNSVSMGNNVTVMMIYEFVKLLSSIHINHILLSIASLYISKLLNGGMIMCYVSVKCINMLMDRRLVITTDDQLKLLKLLSCEDEIVQIHILKLLFKLINDNNFKLIFNTIFTHYHSLTHKSFIELNTINYINTINIGDPEGANNIPLEGANNIPREGANNIPREGATVEELGDREGANIIRGEIAKLEKWRLKIMIELLLKSSNVFFILNNIVKLLNNSVVQWLHTKCLQLLPNRNIKLLLIHLVTHFPQLYTADVVTKILSDRWDKLELYWIYNNLRHFSTVNSMENTVNTVENVENVVNSVKMCKSVELRQVMLEMKNMKKHKFEMTNNKSYDIKLSFLNDWVRKDVRRYERKRYDPEPEPIQEQKLNFKPYQLISNTIENTENNTIEVDSVRSVTVENGNTMEKMEREERLIIDIKNKSWGPKGYINTVNSVNTVNTVNSGNTVTTVTTVNPVDSVNTVNSVGSNSKREEELAKKIFENINPTL
ncbi:Adaptin N terminal region family protein [Theileria parva strain Muguga]|uniref:Adaptin N terminal region family protein n=1 Tax=Theileria parva strain Muguga TaxID=333668 RepID=UPI001C61C19A|nr:Adaptin N terminal region family protein [Theileria parva strain Muguga]EAN31458.2 Adaptin N terminal region family protein [Theileria parva strain Muguga]